MWIVRIIQCDGGSDSRKNERDEEATKFVRMSGAKGHARGPARWYQENAGEWIGDDTNKYLEASANIGDVGGIVKEGREQASELIGTRVCKDVVEDNRWWQIEGVGQWSQTLRCDRIITVFVETLGSRPFRPGVAVVEPMSARQKSWGFCILGVEFRIYASGVAELRRRRIVEAAPDIHHRTTMFLIHAPMLPVYYPNLSDTLQGLLDRFSRNPDYRINAGRMCRLWQIVAPDALLTL
ncbi:hypothetical protein C8F01DRAFT_1234119 [Mycena amicta]|nr:hypothetical protein C8F01DRAFT_1234119 [Mycena amicta]